MGAIVVVVLLVGVVALAPTLLSTSAGTGAAVGVVNGIIRGRLALDGLSMSWAGPMEVRGLRITDPAGRQVVQIPRISLTHGLWRAARRYEAFEGLSIEKPEVLVYVTPDGRITVGDALSPRHPSASSRKNQPLPRLAGKVTVRDGLVKIVREQAGGCELSGVSGDVDLNTLDDVTGRVELGLMPLSGDETPAGSSEPIAKVNVNGRWADSKLVGRLDVAGKAGSAQADVNYQAGVGSVGLSGDRIVAGLASGEIANWPELTCDAKAAIDVGVLGRTFPELLKIRADRQLTGGRLDVKRLTVTAGARPSMLMTAALTDVAATEGTKSLRLSPINVDVDAIVETGKGLIVRQFAMNAAFARLSAAGTPSKLRADLKANLASLQGELGQVFDFGGTKLGGDLDGILEISQSQPDRMDLNLRAGLSGLHYANGNRSLELGKVSVAQAGTLAMVNREPAQYTARTLTVNVDDRVLASGSGEYDWKQKKIAAALDVTRADLAFIAGRAAGLGAAGMAGCAGDVHLQARMESGGSSNAMTSLAGQGEVQDLVVGTGPSAVRPGKVALGYGVRIDPEENQLIVEKLDLLSQPLSLQAKGRIARYDSDRVLSLSGQYQASWPDLTAVLHQLAPSTANTLSFTGKSSSPFQVTGAAHKPGAQPSFREIASGLQISWETADVYGVKTGKAVLSPTLKEGQLLLPAAAIPAMQGKVNLGGMIDFQPANANLRIPGQLQLLHNVMVTREMGDLLLSRLNPIFSHVASLKGRVNLDMNDVVLPLGEAAKTSGAGRGRLDLREMRIGPGGFMSELLAFSGLGSAADYPVEIGAVDFWLKNGRVFYDKFSLTFPEQFDLVFRGSVGFDETLDLVVSLPIRPALLTRLGVVGPVQEYARLLAGSRIEVPLVGTRENPKLDLSKVDTQGLLKGVLQKSAGQPVQDLQKSAGQQAQDLLKLLPGSKKK